MGYIYKITNNINNKIYIGKTVSTIAQRWSKHLYAYKKYNWQLYLAMRKYGVQNFKIEEIEECEDFKLNEREKYWINFFDSFKTGYNSTEGGDGRVQINRDLVREKWLEGKSCKQIANELEVWSSSIISILKDLKLYDAEEIKFRKSIDIANSQTEKRIIQYDENGKVIKFYSSVLEASREVNGLAESIQSGIVQGGSRYGYFWGREGEKLPNFHQIKRPQIRKIYQYDLNNNLLAEYDSAAEAARQINVTSASSILRACKGTRKSAYGYLWSYERR